MLGLYLYTLKIGLKSFNMLSILHKLTLQKKLQNFVTNNVCFLYRKVTTQQQQNKTSNKKPLSEPGFEHGASRAQSGCVNFAPPSQLRRTIYLTVSTQWVETL